MLWLAYQRRVRQLQRKSRELRDMIETIPAMAWTARPDGSDPFVNRRWAEFTGLSADSRLLRAGRTPSTRRIARRMRISGAHPLLPASRSNPRRAFVAVNGEYRWLLARAVPFRDVHGRIVRWYGLLTDIADRKRAEEERERLRELETELAHINRVSMMGELVASIAHEVNQPLGAIVSNGSACLRWLAAQNLERAQQSALRIVADGQRAGAIITRIRALVQKAPPHKVRFELAPLVDEVVRLTQPECVRQGVALHVEVAPDLPPVVGDRVQVQQVLLNLVLNALEALATVTERPREVWIRTHQAAADTARVAVEDSGVGLAPEQLDQIFTAFYTTKAQGLGVGLAISRRIMRRTAAGCGRPPICPVARSFSSRCHRGARREHDRRRGPGLRRR